MNLVELERVQQIVVEIQERVQTLSSAALRIVEREMKRLKEEEHLAKLRQDHLKE